MSDSRNSIVGPVIGVCLAAGALTGIFTAYADQWLNGKEHQAICAAMAQDSGNAPEQNAQRYNGLYSDFMNYDGQDEIMRRAANIENYEFAQSLGMTFWNPRYAGEGGGAIDLDTSWGDVAREVVVGVATTKIIDAKAVIDNRDPDRGPVFVYLNFENSGFDALMEELRDSGITSREDLPEGFIISLKAIGARGIVYDATGEEVMKTNFDKLVEDSAWNPDMKDQQERKLKEKIKDGIVDLIRPSDGP